jgi:hypothetical protein
VLSRRLLFVAALVAAASCVRAPARLAQPAQRDQLYSQLIGSWQGTLEYKDYQDSTRRVTLPTRLKVLPAPDRDGLELQFTYDDGPGKTVRSTVHWHFDRALEDAEWGSARDSALQAFTVTAREGGQRGTPIRLVLEGQGADDDRPARIRETLEVSAGAVRLTKETQFEGASLAFRHAYTFRRAE